MMLRKFLFLFAALLLFSPISYGQNIDIKVLREINLNRNQSLDGTFKTITNSAVPIIVGMPAGMFGIGLIKGDSTLIRNAVEIGASVVSSTIVCTILKKAVKRTRPYTTYPDLEELTTEGSYSFPSNHTSGAFSLATSLSLEYPKWYVIVPSYTWASAVAYSRMDLGVHYPSDVLMGAVLGAGSAYLCHYLNKKLFKKNAGLHW
jgi:membrane-associated phospholipid phosphatase